MTRLVKGADDHPYASIVSFGAAHMGEGLGLQQVKRG
jgi:hypothetical protein